MAALFPLLNSWLLLLSFLLALASIFLCNSKHQWALVCLLFAAFLLRLFMAGLDPFLHEWDERFHALVARNMMDHPFTPMLRVSDWATYDYRDWSRNHIWLHKQPLFLWQMALSMKLLGVSPFAIRFPGVIMGSIGVLFVYRIGLLLTTNRNIAFLAALLTCFSYYPLELMSGLFGMDQNDTAFSFYVLASLWAYAEYSYKKTWKYAILAGLFAGGAILIKWLTGLLVFSAWGIILTSEIRKEHFKKEIVQYLVALLTCAMVFVPWQLYIMHRFPIEAAFEYEYNLRRLHEAVDARSGTWLFYVNNFGLYYGEVPSWLVPVGLILLVTLRQFRTKLTFAVVFYFVLTLVFFSFVSKTMVPAYVMPIVPLGNIFIAIAVCLAFSNPKVFKYAWAPVSILLALLIFNLPEVTHKHDPSNIAANDGKYWSVKAHNNEVYKNLRKYIPPDVHIVLNAMDYTDIMFYNKDIDAYFSYISPNDFDKLKKQHLHVGVFKNPTNPMPDYVWSYDNIYVIEAELK